MLNHILPIGQYAIGSPDLMFDYELEYDPETITRDDFTLVSPDIFMTAVDPGVYVITDGYNIHQLVESTNGYLVLCKWDKTTTGRQTYECRNESHPKKASCDSCKTMLKSFIDSYCVKIDNMKLASYPDKYMSEEAIKKMGSKFGYNAKKNIEIIINTNSKYGLVHYQIICGTDIINAGNPEFDNMKMISKFHYENTSIRKFMEKSLSKDEYRKIEAVMVRQNSNEKVKMPESLRLVNVVIGANRVEIMRKKFTPRMGPSRFQPPPPPRQASTASSDSENIIQHRAVPMMQSAFANPPMFANFNSLEPLSPSAYMNKETIPREILNKRRDFVKSMILAFQAEEKCLDQIS